MTALGEIELRAPCSCTYKGAGRGAGVCDADGPYRPDDPGVLRVRVVH